MSRHKYTAEQLAFIRDNVSGRSFTELTALFNSRFGTDYPKSTVISTAYRYGCRNGRNTRLNKGWKPTQFKKGHAAHNKGKKKWWTGGEATQFQPGHMPSSYKPVGTETVRADGYVYIKVADPKTWRMKHVLIYEAAYGPVPKSKIIIFADGNRLNMALDNLLLISRLELAVMNKRHLISADTDLIKAGVAVADIYLKIGERKRGENV